MMFNKKKTWQFSFCVEIEKQFVNLENGFKFLQFPIFTFQRGNIESEIVKFNFSYDHTFDSFFSSSNLHIVFLHIFSFSITSITMLNGLKTRINNKILLHNLRLNFENFIVIQTHNNQTFPQSLILNETEAQTKHCHYFVVLEILHLLLFFPS